MFERDTACLGSKSLIRPIFKDFLNFSPVAVIYFVVTTAAVIILKIKAQDGAKTRKQQTYKVFV